MTFKEEAKKVSSLISEEGRSFLPQEDSRSHHYKFFRLPKITPPAKPKTTSSAREPLSAHVLHIHEQERKGKTEGWGVAAAHAHHCCASQKHPAFVHLEQLLRRGSALDNERVTKWQFKEYLLAAKKLKSLVKQQLEKPEAERKKRIIARIDESLPAKEEKAWDEYFQAQNQARPENQLFQMPGTFK